MLRGNFKRRRAVNLLRAPGFLLAGLMLLALLHAQADDPVAGTFSVSELADRIRPSIVVIHSSDREGRPDRGVGTGFVVSADGLIATNLHVIGEGRPFRIELADGSQPQIVAVHAADAHWDLAVVRVQAPQPLRPLQLADTPLPVGATVVAFGNPFGLKNSVVSGVLSGRRLIEGRQMLQLAMPVEPGNSGGPLVDSQGMVHGVITMKSALSDNLGFATDSAALRALLERPNPISIERWVTMGRLPPERWQTLFGAQWRLRGGTIHVHGAGEGFGGRSLCLWQHNPPPPPWEVEVEVRLDDESGAAGLVFHSDGNHCHYGFYPSNGRLRLTAFQGATVFDWHVLQEEPCAAYQPGQWNRLKVRVEQDRFLCYVNGTLLFSSQDKTFSQGRVGLAKFRDTVAEFRRFSLRPAQDPPAAMEDRSNVASAIASLLEAREITEELLQPLLNATDSADHLRQEAERRERQAQLLRAAQEELHIQTALRQLKSITAKEPFDLLRAALWIAYLDDPDLDVEAYVHQVEEMAQEVQRQLPEGADELTRLAALDKYLFEENGYHGSRHEYYHRANSHLHRVIDDREGLPITLSLLYMELAQRLGLRVEGLALPGHFLVRCVRQQNSVELIDVFNRGKRLTSDEVLELIRSAAPQVDPQEYLRAATAKEIVQRILRNLLNVAERDNQPAAMRRYLEVLVLLDPDNVQYRGMRALSRYYTGMRQAAVADLDWFLQQQPPGVDLERIRQMRERFLREITP
jgi:serine protease Do